MVKVRLEACFMMNASQNIHESCLRISKFGCVILGTVKSDTKKSVAAGDERNTLAILIHTNIIMPNKRNDKVIALSRQLLVEDAPPKAKGKAHG